MRTPSIATMFFNPGDPPADPAQLQRYLRELNTILSATFGALAAGHLDMLTVAPGKPRNGDWAYADGANWNPGGTGKGLYLHNGAVWTLIKAIP